jgi:hypothetical protein
VLQILKKQAINMLMRFSGTALVAASKTKIWKGALIRLRKSFTNIKKGRGFETDDFQTTEHTKKQ